MATHLSEEWYAEQRRVTAYAVKKGDWKYPDPNAPVAEPPRGKLRDHKRDAAPTKSEQ